ncbi:MAG TPA: hypothetical protein VKX49_07445 [Bryobacteraceae bacterium]|nr:hypothetical protein [Bryobacteraceae bacterium]
MSYGRGPLDFSRTVRITKLAWSQVKSRVLYPTFQNDGMYNANSEAYRVTEKIFDVFYRNVLEDGALPVVVIFPDTVDQPRSRQHKPLRYTPLLNHFNSNGYRYIDVLNAIQPHESRYRMEDLSARFGHYTPLGNQIVAEYMLEQLKHLDLLDPNEVKQKIAAERKRLGIGGEPPERSDRWRRASTI